MSDSNIEKQDMATAVLLEHWGRDGRFTRLPGENINLLVREDGNEPCVLKITIDASAEVELEESVLERLHAGGIPVPQTIPSLTGDRIVHVDHEGVAATARLQGFLPGTQWRELGSNPKRLEAIGSMLARMHLALKGFCEQHPEAHRTHDWDLARAGRHRKAIERFDDRKIRRGLETAFHLLAAEAVPRLEACPSGMLHGDPNDENFLLDGDVVVGVVDVGDCQEAALIQDLAIALSYALQSEGATLEDAAILVAAYDHERQLQAVEERVLFPLVMARLACSAAIGALRRQETEEHATWFSHESTTLDALMRNIDLSPAEARARLLSGCRQTNRSTADTEFVLSERRRLIGPSLSVSYRDPLHITEGRGQYLIAADGRPYLDLVNNVCHVGHCHPQVVKAIARQAEQLNTNTRYLHENVSRFAERLVDTLPEGLDTCFFVNSGSEANELALRLARTATGARDVLVVDGAYHGSTGNCVAMSPYKFDGPGGTGAPEWVHVVPIPDGYRGEIRGHDEDTGAGYALEVGRVIGEACAKGRSVAGFFVEPILSCGGQVPLPPGYLAAAFEHVRKAGGLAIADEVQVGFGRVGDAFWGFQLHDVVPDIVVMGKPMGNGHPLGAVVTTRRIAEAFDNGMEFFSTFGGNPVSCACGLAVLDVIRDESLQERAAALGDRFRAGLESLMARHALIGDVRGSGLFLGIELVRDRATLEPADTEAATVVNHMRERGILLSTDGPLHNVIKIKPPMVLEESDIDMTLRQLDDVLGSIM
ncbi:MAG: aminotransferase class III-fold pyridoxal phosphate-dependent enzyme [Phycisphaerales bacterium]|nr:aminotransferase class III-fold pyridoxal phosphate-dependent enzyme [Phycisphaerales bacterium]